MPTDFPDVTWDDALAADARELVRLAKQEDLAGGKDVTTETVVDPKRRGEAAVVPRQPGVAAGLAIVPMVLEAFGADAVCETLCADGDPLVPGRPAAWLRGRAADLLACERTVLNFLGRLCGIATLARRYAEQVAGTAAQVYDTRKTTPGWRRLEKYAVRCGGGRNHRLGLSEAVLIKDNHLALAAEGGLTPADAVRKARRELVIGETESIVIEVEVDTLEQLESVLPAEPDLVLLDNMSPAELRQAVALRNQLRDGRQPGGATQLEASGGITLDTIATVAATGVERISVGALTHSAVGLDLGLDWGR